MARMAAPDPYESLKRQQPRIGAPVQNTGGFAPSTAPLGQRPVSTPTIRLGTPGPTPMAQPVPGVTPPPPVPLAPAPAPAPAAPAPAAPAPAPAPTPAGAPAGGMYGSGGGVSPGTSKTLEDEIRGYITGAMGGVTSKGFIDRAKNQLGSSVEGQRAASQRRLDEGLIGRGMFGSGLRPELALANESAARGTLASGISDILSKGEQQDIAGRESAAGTAGNLLSMNRQQDQYTQQRIDEENARRAAAAAGGPSTFEYTDPDTGQTFTLDESWF